MWGVNFESALSASALFTDRVLLMIAYGMVVLHAEIRRREITTANKPSRCNYYMRRCLAL
jgi:hypothetical protein